MSERRWRYGIAGLLFLGVLAAYVESMAGSASFWDCGEFIACAYSLGIPHPPATPLYVVLGRVFTLLPLPLTIAQKVNFMSALFGALGVAVLFLIVEFLIRERRGDPRSALDRWVVYGSAAVGALFTAWSNTYWTNAIEAEVYSISAFVMGVTTLLALRWGKHPDRPGSERSIYLIIYLLSLGVGFHLGTVLTYPAIALYLLLFRRKTFADADLVVFSFGFFLFLFHVNLKFSGTPAALALLLFLVAFAVRSLGGKRFVPIATGLFVLGITIHLFLLIRSAQNPAIDEADPETWANLMAVLRREQYPPSSIFERKASWHFQIIEHFWRYFTEQWQLTKGSGWFTATRSAFIPIALGLAGMLSLLRQRRSAILLGGTFLITSLGMIVFLNFSDNEVRERDYFYSPAFYFYGMFIGLGAAAVLDWFFGAGRCVARLSGVDRTGYVAGVAVFLLLTAMVYDRYHFEHDRTRERVPWGYGYNMLAGLEPNALIFTNGDNDTFPLWYQQEVERFRRDVRVINLSLLNTDWYPKQLRDNEPKVFLSWTDEEIEGLPDRALQIYRATGKAYQPRDLAVRQILRDNFGKKPIYFAVTIPRQTLREYMDHLVLEGLVYHFQREKGQDMVDYDKLAYNVDNVYRFDGILTADGKHDDTVYLDPNQRTLVQNYAGAFIRLGNHEEEQARAATTEEERTRHRREAMRRYEQALAISPDFEQLVLLLGNSYLEFGEYEAAVRLYEEQRARHPDNDRYVFELGRAYLAAGRDDEGIRLLRQVARRNPDDEFLHQYLVHTLWDIGRPAEAENLVAEWEARRPGDRSLRDFFSEVQQGSTSMAAPIPGRGSDAPPIAVPRDS